MPRSASAARIARETSATRLSKGENAEKYIVILFVDCFSMTALNSRLVVSWGKKDV
jgi:hypothetical protein